MGSTYEIVNVVGKSYHVVRYWNDETQFSKQLTFPALSPSAAITLSTSLELFFGLVDLQKCLMVGYNQLAVRG